ncbi:MAG: RND family transporter, partial [Acidobacteria bacterium]|nr:RND family transporter [Acidobacteriota bacterium]
EKNPQLKVLEAYEDTYTKDKNAFIAVEAKESDLFTPETLAAIEELTEAAWQIPYSRRVDSITNFQHTWADGDDLVVEKLVRMLWSFPYDA